MGNHFDRTLNYIQGAVFIATAASIIGMFVYKSHIGSNLEDHALDCNNNNVIGFPDFGMNLPKISNRNIDDDPEYESILIYKNGFGQKVFREITLENGKIEIKGPVQSLYSAKR
jgi:hypothetical protein